MNSIRLFISIITISGLFSACNETSTQSETAKTDSIAVPLVPVEIKDSVSAQVYNHYIQLKDVLVASDPAKAKTVASELAIALRKVKGSENTAVLAEKIAASTDLCGAAESVLLL
jgi:hypothetical protein